MDENRRDYIMDLMEKRINNLMLVMKRAKDYDMKDMWSRKLQQLFDLRARKAYERLENQARMVPLAICWCGQVLAMGVGLMICKYSHNL